MAEEGIAAGGVMDVNTALEEVLRPAFIHDGLARGIREAAKALGKRQAHLCVLPTVMSLCRSSWWRPFVLSTRST